MILNKDALKQVADVLYDFVDKAPLYGVASSADHIIQVTAVAELLWQAYKDNEEVEIWVNE